MTARPSEPAEQSLRELTRRIARRRWLLLAVFLVVFSAVAVWAFTATPRYRSAARASKVARRHKHRRPGLRLGARRLPAGRDELETEVGVLRGDRMADATIDSLALGYASPRRPRAARILDARVVDRVGVNGASSLVSKAAVLPRRESIDDTTVTPPGACPALPCASAAR
jgi:uncharacterized protein involved in exopolysaccharide biosynthesis